LNRLLVNDKLTPECETNWKTKLSPPQHLVQDEYKQGNETWVARQINLFCYLFHTS